MLTLQRYCHHGINSVVTSHTALYWLSVERYRIWYAAMALPTV